MTMTRELLSWLWEHGADGAPRRALGLPRAGISESPAAASNGDIFRKLHSRAALLDPQHAEDLAQQALIVGLEREREDGLSRNLDELTAILHSLTDAEQRTTALSTPEADVSAPIRERSAWFDGLDGDADEPELYYPDLYPQDDPIEGWVDSPNQWRGAVEILAPEQNEELTDLYSELELVLDELPAPLGTLIELVDIQGHSLVESAYVLGLDEYSAASMLARGRNHVRGRLDTYLAAGGS
ncbi:hypothetical protein [Cumulibacter soli]|uniref:hypothetical protein n=1 Tax=Cumulibacter soli TaxID=2546344 RepID=UPI0010675DA6|nr:hypothetical protein [Cumulibacter soli]